jgi:hypothetical protein
MLRIKGSNFPLGVNRMQNFTPLASLSGGLLIGLSASAMLLLDGKIAGISGIFAGVFRPLKGDTLWKACFLAGLFAGGLVLRVLVARRACSCWRVFLWVLAPGSATDAPAVTACAA